MRRLLPLVGVVLSFTPQGVAAQLFVDQFNGGGLGSRGPASFASPGTGNRLGCTTDPAGLRLGGQSFRPRNNNIAGLTTFVVYEPPRGTTGPRPVTFSLFDVFPGTPGATPLLTVVQDNPATGAGARHDIFFAPISVTPEALYYFTITTPGPFCATQGFGEGAGLIGNWQFDAYTRGSTILIDPRAALAHPDADLLFQTYYDVSLAVVPEPGTWALLGTGLLAIGGLTAARRRRER